MYANLCSTHQRFFVIFADSVGVGVSTSTLEGNHDVDLEVAAVLHGQAGFPVQDLSVTA